jgi:hypothetical protein
VANTEIEPNLSTGYKTAFLLGASLSFLLHIPLLQRIYKGKDTRGFLFCKPKMHEVVASALQNSLSGF